MKINYNSLQELQSLQTFTENVKDLICRSIADAPTASIQHCSLQAEEQLIDMLNVLLQTRLVKSKTAEFTNKTIKGSLTILKAQALIIFKYNSQIQTFMPVWTSNFMLQTTSEIHKQFSNY
jgi:hypothetical protein